MDPLIDSEIQSTADASEADASDCVLYMRGK